MEHGCEFTDHPSLPLSACACGAVKAGELILKVRPDKEGYRLADYGKRGHRSTVRVHRIVLACFAGEDSREVDHIDRDKTNNARSNLRYVTRTENALNTSIRAHSESQIRNVRWRKDRNCWQAYVVRNKKFKSLGHFKTVEEAYVVARQHYAAS